MIYHVESVNDDAPAYTCHISSNLELAYSKLMESSHYALDRSLTVIHSDTGEEIIYFWASKFPSIETIEKGIADATARLRVL